MASKPPDLDPAQRRAVEHLTGPLLVLAGPGSGKTRVVTHRIARLIARGVGATNILAVTFTNKAAREMRDRVKALVRDRGRGLTVATFHAACVRILRAEIDALGYGRNFSIYDQASQESLMRTILRDFSGDGATRSASAVLQGGAAMLAAAEGGAAPTPAPAPAPPPPAAAAAKRARRSKKKAAEPGPAPEPPPPGMTPEEAARAAFITAAHSRYREELRARNAVDFDDLITLTVRLFRERPDVLGRWRQRFQQVLVDEYQDTNAAQDEVLRLLAGGHRNLCVVGDDDQSIYGWRGAEVDHILTFTQRFPEAAVVKLERNYRSTSRIVAAASHVIAKNPHRHHKDLFSRRPPGDAVRVLVFGDEEEEAQSIAAEIAKVVDAADDKQRYEAASAYAVLFRTNEQIRPLEQALRAAKLPYRLLGGKSFFDRKEVLDLLAYLRVSANRADEEALFRIVNTPARGLGAKAIETLRAEARSTGTAVWDVLVKQAGAGDDSALSPAARAGASELARTIERLTVAGLLPSPTLVGDLVTEIGYEDEIDRTYKDANVRASRRALAAEVQKSWTTHLTDPEAGGLEGFLDGLALRGRDDDDHAGGGVVLATVHASKGLEFAAVYIGGMEEGIFPHARSTGDAKAMAEERRVFYVALTRARHRLTLTRCAKRTLRGKELETVPSRFLDDLPGESLEVVDTTAPPPEEVMVDRFERMRARFRGGSA